MQTIDAQYWVAMIIGIACFGGIGGLFIWAALRGQFRNVEAAKTRMLFLDNHTKVHQ